MFPGIDPSRIDPVQAVALVKEGSPLLLNAIGRVVGFGASEQQALVQGRIPWWAFLGMGLGLGFVLGARVERRYKGQLPKFVTGE